MLKPQCVEFVARRQRDVIGFVEVVVFGGHPEDGDRTRILRLANGSGRFEQREQRAAEERDLLARDNRSRASAQFRYIFERRVARAELAVLRFQKIGNRGVLRGIVHGGDDGSVRRSSIERSEWLPAGRVIQKQATQPGQSRNGVTLGVQIASHFLYFNVRAPDSTAFNSARRFFTGSAHTAWWAKER